jgi:hypothetical protein
METAQAITPVDTQSNDLLMQTLNEWASFPGDYVISTLAGMDIGAYLGFVEADIDGVLSIAISVVLTPLIVFLLIYPFKNLIDVILHCLRHELRQDRIKCKTGFVVLALFLTALAVKQYPIESWIQDASFGLFIASWITWFGIGRWWLR